MERFYGRPAQKDLVSVKLSPPTRDRRAFWADEQNQLFLPTRLLLSTLSAAICHSPRLAA